MNAGTKSKTLADDEAVLLQIEEHLIKATGGREAFRKGLSLLFRRAIDEVIDTPRTRRRVIEDLEKTEKTYLGTKVEILFRNLLRLEKGQRLDLRVGEREVDVKFTIGQNWTIPQEAEDEVCLLLSCSEASATFSAGLFVAGARNLNPGLNRDRKRTISKEGRARTHWMFWNETYPANFWATVPADDAAAIMDMTASGTERIRRLFVALPGRPIPRKIVESVAQQKDYMKRLRRNGGARDSLERDGYRLLSGAYDYDEISSRGLPKCMRDEFICVKA